jgi:dynein heavy chain
MRSLPGFIKDLNQRMKMMKMWIESGEAPTVFWLPGFYFPHAFLTAILQAHATKMSIPINTLTLDFKYSDTFIPHEDEGCI